jgi:MFS family permease
MNNPKSFLTRNVIILSIVSFFTDIATEMLYPIMPLYLSDIGYGIALIAIIEGFAQLVAGAIKVFSGVYSDYLQKRKGLINIGYGVSALAKPLMAVFPTYWAIFGFRLLDRFGKGIRTAPRDAMLADVSMPVNRGRVFAFHRAADTVGATLGPLITLALLFFFDSSIAFIIALTVIPGAAAIVFGLFIKEKKKRTALPTAVSGGPRKFLKRLKNYYRSASARYKQVLLVLVVLTLLKSTDIFLLLRARELGLSDVLIISAYVVYNLAGALLIYYLGKLSDRVGFAKTFSIGALALGATYVLLSQNELPLALIFVVSKCVRGAVERLAFAAYQTKRSRHWPWPHDGLTSSCGADWCYRCWRRVDAIWRKTSIYYCGAVLSCTRLLSTVYAHKRLRQ